MQTPAAQRRARSRRYLRAATIVAALGSTAVLGAAAAPETGGRWGIEVLGAAHSTADLKRLKAQGFDTLIVDTARGRPAARTRLASRARGAGMSVAVPRKSSARLETLCKADRRGASRSCAVLASSAKSAVSLARRNVADFVVLRVDNLGQLRYLRGLKTRTRVVAVARLPQARLDQRAWSRAVAIAKADPALELAVSVRAVTQPALRRFVSLVRPNRPASAPPAQPSPGTANLWVDPNGGSCRRSSSPAPYADANACRSLHAAYQAAAAGDTVLIRGGTYPDQDIGDKPSLPVGSAPVVFHPAPGEEVVIDDGMDIYAHDLVLDGGDRVGVNEPNRIRVIGEPRSAGGRSIDIEHDGPTQRRNVVIEDVHTSNIFFTADYSTVRYSEIGPHTACNDLVLTGRVRGVVVEYNLIHDNIGTRCGSVHIDALDLDMVEGVIRGNRIWACGTQCVFTGDPGSMLIENNMIEETNSCDDCGGPAELALMGENIVRYNTIEGSDGYGLPDRPGNSNVYGNIFLDSYDRCTWGPNVSVTYSHNVFGGGRGCGANRKVCRPRLADGHLYTDVDRKADYHLHPQDTCARGAGNAGAHPAEDLDEERRPQGGAVDAGADER